MSFFSSKHDDNVISVLSSHNDGLIFSDLFALCKEFVEEKELSQYLHLRITRGLIYKKDGMYFINEKFRKNVPTVVEEIRSLIASDPELSKLQNDDEVENSKGKVVRSDTFKRTYYQKDHNENDSNVKNVAPTVDKTGTVGYELEAIINKVEHKKIEEKAIINKNNGLGNLTRESVIGRYGYIFFSLRNQEGLTNIEIRKLVEKYIPVSDSSHYQSIHTLKKKNYIKKVDSDGVSKFKWTGLYQYPFSAILHSDKCLFSGNTDNFFNDTVFKEESPSFSTENAESIKISSHESNNPLEKGVYKNIVTETLDHNFLLTEDSHNSLKTYFDELIKTKENELLKIKELRALLETNISA